MIREIRRDPASGIALLFIVPLALIGCLVFAIRALAAGSLALGLGGLALVAVLAVCLGGVFAVAPNEGRVLQLFGDYVGTARRAGLRWANPFYTARRVSLRVRNFETGKLKVNDSRGNPIEIGAVVVWQVVDTAEAVFGVDDFEHFVHVQSEAALRSLATGYPYDAHADAEVSLSGNTAGISDRLAEEIQERLDKAGVKVIEARISHLAYASEIAAAMLQRQQASAVVAARQTIVEGAVGMVETALEMLREREIVELDAVGRGRIVNDLLVVLCSDRAAQPVLDLERG